jgi:hypothetical protein
MKLKTTKRKYAENKMEKKSYRTFPDLWNVQPIPFTLSSLEFDSPLEECFFILGSLLPCFEGSS